MPDPVSRRAELRFSLAFPVVLSGSLGIRRAVARNISAGGIFIETDEPYPLGSHLAITFELPSGEASFIARGEVKHAVRFAYGAPRPGGFCGLGVKFLSFEAGDIAPHLRAAPI